MGKVLDVAVFACSSRSACGPSGAHVPRGLHVLKELHAKAATSKESHLPVRRTHAMAHGPVGPMKPHRKIIGES